MGNSQILAAIVIVVRGSIIGNPTIQKEEAMAMAILPCCLPLSSQDRIIGFHSSHDFRHVTHFRVSKKKGLYGLNYPYVSVCDFFPSPHVSVFGCPQPRQREQTLLFMLPSCSPAFSASRRSSGLQERKTTMLTLRTWISAKSDLLGFSCHKEEMTCKIGEDQSRSATKTKSFCDNNYESR